MAPFIRQRWQFVALRGLGIGVGTGLVAVVLAATVVNRWFVARRGMVLGILTASASTGQLVFLPMLAQATARYGWRVAVLVVAAILAALCGASTNGLIGAHLIPAAHDHGIPEVRAASMLALS